MIERIFDLYDDLETQRIMLSFKGDLSPDLISAILGLIEQKLASTEPDPKTRKRVFNVVMECLQNLYHHNKRIVGPDGPSLLEEHQGVVMVGHADMGYSILTGNSMAKDEVTELKRRLDQVNGCEPEQLRALYKTALDDGQYTPSGGGGLGLIDIARKSGRKLEYGFVPLDNNNTFFSLNVNVTP
ncbi:MAG TPA: SiaB family protein kinase [Flavobacteriales bacterium]|nr:SiaB family protein kinase [Flavobacteriales bacterium]